MGVRGGNDIVARERGEVALGEYRVARVLVVGVYSGVALLAARDVGLHGMRGADSFFRDGGTFEPGALCLAPVDLSFERDGIVGVERERDEAITEPAWHGASVYVIRYNVGRCWRGVWSGAGVWFLPGSFVPLGVSGGFRAALG